MSEPLLLLTGVLLGAILGGAVAAAVLIRRQSLLQGELMTARGRLEESLEREAGWERDLADLEQRLRVSEERRTRLDEQLQAREQALVEQREILERAKTELSNTFQAIGARALHANNQQFLDLAQQRFRNLLEEARGEGEKRHLAIDSLVRPLKETLERQAQAVQALETKREGAYRGLEAQLKGIARAHEKLETETTRLVTALRRPEQRGRWGEMALRNVVELAGMTAHCDFREQAPTDDDSHARPDLIVRLPGNGQIVVDAKVAIDAYLDALAPDADKKRLLERHAGQVAAHYKKLSRKQYWNQFERTPKLVVMFMPLESALVAALEVHPHLHADAMRDDILIATPTLLVALLRAVAYGWQQEAIAENAQQIAQVGRELYDRLARFAERFDRVGRELDKGARAYNDAVASLEGRLLPSARRLKELQATSKTEIKSPSRVQIDVRSITAGELKPAEE